MKLNTRIRYGIRTMLEIASSDSPGGVYQKNIAEKQDISFKYLDQIIHALKSSMLICNAKGKKSGYVLCRKPVEITIYDIYKAFEPDLCVVECLSGHSNCKHDGKCAAQEIYGDLNGIVIDFLKNITLKDIVEKQAALI